MRNRTPQPSPLDLPPVSNNPIRIYGQLFGPMGQPLAGLRILLKAVTTTAVIMQDTWSESTVDQNGNYDFSVMPGKYAVFFERRGRKERVNNIYVYSDSAQGTLQSFMLAPAADMLTPLMVLEVKSAYEEATAAMLRARQWAENPVDVPVLDFEEGAGPEYSAYHWAHYAKEIIDTDTNINWRGEWDSAAQYAFRDAVRYQSSSYYCIEDNTGTAPPDIATADNAAWSLMAAKGDTGDASSVPGPANTLTVGDVTTVDYGTGSSASITGEAPNQVLNLQLERGADSTVPGPVGPVGPQGPKGDPGSTSTDYNTIGSVVFAMSAISGSGWDPGEVVAGSRLTPAGIFTYNANSIGSKDMAIASYSSSLSGSWRAMSYVQDASDDSNDQAVGVFVRIA
ncbi:prophage tail fiber N-terminal domain-containing protein [Klebsiella aerogenes]|uniref:prophage tail fiber N-terminal domain-containing protein n=1 Tax=Klebsiella aerogenes TaxID=548 RepID=UPI00351CBD45